MKKRSQSAEDRPPPQPKCWASRDVCENPVVHNIDCRCRVAAKTPRKETPMPSFATSNGTCACDGRLETAHDVRRLGVCNGCGQLVLEGHRYKGKRLHTRCAVKMLGLEQCVVLGFGPTMRLCCLGEDGMEKLMDLMAEARHV